MAGERKGAGYSRNHPQRGCEADITLFFSLSHFYLFLVRRKESIEASEGDENGGKGKTDELGDALIRGAISEQRNTMKIMC